VILLPIEFDLVGWAESGAAAGLTARTGITDKRYATSADDQKLRSIDKQAYLAALWGGSVTAAVLEGMEVVSAGKVAADFAAASVRDGMPPALLGSRLKKKDTLTGYIDNAGTAEITAMIAAIAYGNPVVYSPLPIGAGGHAIRIDSTTDTAGTLPAGWVEVTTTWPGVDSDVDYRLIGLGGWGTLDVAARLVSSVEKESSFKPGVPLGTTPAFSCMTYLAQAYEFPGDSVPTIEIQSLGASAEHHLTAIVIPT